MFSRSAVLFALVATVAAEFDSVTLLQMSEASLISSRGEADPAQQMPFSQQIPPKAAVPPLGATAPIPPQFGAKAPIPAEKAASYSFKAAGAEFLAMTLFVVIGCGSAMSAKDEPGWVLQIALTFGLAITSLAYAIGHYSGGQINCAVTLGLVMAGKCSIVQGLLNFVAQMLGSVAGALILTQIIPEAKDKTGGLGSNGVSGDPKNAFVGEVLMTFLLVFVVLETATNPATKGNREMAALAIGFAVFLAHSVLIPIDGCSINPTRSFGPAFVRKHFYSEKNAGNFQDMWVFWAGPLVGAAFAAFVSTQILA